MDILNTAAKQLQKLDARFPSGNDDVHQKELQDIAEKAEEISEKIENVMKKSGESMNRSAEDIPLTALSVQILKTSKELSRLKDKYEMITPDFADQHLEPLMRLLDGMEEGLRRICDTYLKKILNTESQRIAWGHPLGELTSISILCAEAHTGEFLSSKELFRLCDNGLPYELPKVVAPYQVRSIGVGQRKKHRIER